MKMALRVIQRMKPSWARRALKRKTWSKGIYWFSRGVPSPFAAGVGGAPDKEGSGFQSDARELACQEGLADAMEIFLGNGSSANEIKALAKYCRSLQACSNKEIRAALKKAAGQPRKA